MAIAVFGQKKDNTQAVIDAAEKLRLAMISGEKSALKSLIVPELTYGHSGGHIDDAKEFVEKLVSKKSDFLTIDIPIKTSVSLEIQQLFVTIFMLRLLILEKLREM